MSQSSSWKKSLENAAVSDLGLAVRTNQDSFVVFLAGNQQDYRRRGHLFMVADGMGAHAAGELASKIATDIVPLTYHKLREQAAARRPLRRRLWTQIARFTTGGRPARSSRAWARRRLRWRYCRRGLWWHTWATAGHIASAAQRIDQLTFDHSLVWELQASRAEVRGADFEYIGKNIITRSLGPNPKVQVDLEGPHPCQPGDTFLLCSDGLSGPVRMRRSARSWSVCRRRKRCRRWWIWPICGAGRITSRRCAHACWTGQGVRMPMGSRAATRAMEVPRSSAGVDDSGHGSLGGIGAVCSWADDSGGGFAAGVCGHHGHSGHCTERQRRGRGTDDGRPAFRARSVRELRLPAGREVCSQADGDYKPVARRGFGRELEDRLGALQPFLGTANDARNAADYVASAREYLRAISFMMAELKHQRPHRDESSGD